MKHATHEPREYCCWEFPCGLHLALRHRGDGDWVLSIWLPVEDPSWSQSLDGSDELNPPATSNTEEGEQGSAGSEVSLRARMRRSLQRFLALWFHSRQWHARSIRQCDSN